tara:strand:- start:971 stop:1228 length:258 start_codon:yes stop_codon:yes gene_type:complete
MDIAQAISDYGFPIVMAVGMGYFIFFIWKFINEKIDPALEKMHFALIRVIDQTRMLDQDLIRLQQKVDVVLEYRENEKKRKEDDK